MDNNNKHINNGSVKPEDPLEIISGTYIDWGKSKEQVWQEIESRIDANQPDGRRVLIAPWIKVAIAAVFVILVGFSVFMQLYTKTIEVPSGKHSSIFLPDNSSVQLNAESTLSYKPLLWKFSRDIRFDGEAFFEVREGKEFKVITENGKAHVLGTSFNVYSRNNDYNVTCVTGTVKVTENINKGAVILNPGEKATLNPEGILVVESGLKIEEALLWLDNKLNFTSVPLSKVFKEIGRQFGVIINIPDNLDSIYTGTFNINTPVEQTLNLVCKPFNLTFTLISKDEYIITRKAQDHNY